MRDCNLKRTAMNSTNDSCLRPPPSILGCKPYPDEDVWYETCHFRRLLLRIPICIFSFVSTYLAIALVYDAVLKPTTKATRYGSLLNRSRAFATSFVAIVMIYSTFSVLIEENPDVNCDWFGKVENGLNWLSLSVVYLVLWFRQRAIFKQESLRHTLSPVTSHLSLWTIALVVVLPVVNIGLFSGSVTFCFDPVLGICGIKGYSATIFALELVVPLLVPTCLVALFVLPLIRHHRFIRGSIRNPVKGKVSVIGMVRRSFVLTTICLLTDIGSIFCNSYLPLLGSFVTRLLSVFSNMICMNLCFSDCKQVLTFGHGKAKGNSATSTRVTTARLKRTGGGEIASVTENMSSDTM